MPLPDFDPTLLHDFPDRLVRHGLTDKANLRDLLTDAVPQLAPNFVWEEAVLLPPAFPMGDWRYRISDLLFQIPYRLGNGKKTVWVCVLIEHQSAPDPRIPLRALLHAVSFWEREWKAWEQLPTPRPDFRLTPVLPIVFYTGGQPWNSNRTVAELLREPEAFRTFAPRFSPLFWDLAEKDPAVLLGSTLEWLQALAVVRSTGEEREEFQRVMGEAVAKLGALAESDEVRWSELLRFVLGWALHRRPEEERPELVELAERGQRDVRRKAEVKQMGRTIAQALMDEGREEGEKKGRKEGEKLGRKEGRQEGKLVALQETLVDLLRHRFGRVSRQLKQRIAEVTDTARLRDCILRCSDIASTDELGL